jgi:uncharacterized integral membrane protein (TIGR00698 family)
MTRLRAGPDLRLVAGIAPGLGLCALVALAAVGLQAVEQRLFGHAWLEGLVLAILLGVFVRYVWSPGARWRPGVTFSAKAPLEIAVVLMGASVSARTLTALGPMLLAGVGVVVVAAIAGGYALGVGLGLPRRLALLVACGNGICGNSAIAAVAPIIGAEGAAVAPAIAFTAVLGVASVLALPVLATALHLTVTQSGALAGLTVYAVPQVLAAAAPLGSGAVQVGTVVKLVRVLMLGPVCLALSWIWTHGPTGPARSSRIPIPWFVVGFVVLMVARSATLIPPTVVPVLSTLCGLMTVAAMAALGLETEVRALGAAGGRVIVAAMLSLAALAGISLGLIKLVGVV